MLRLNSFIAYSLIAIGGSLHAQESPRDYSPHPSERQLPHEMHSKMAERPEIRVGIDSGDLRGNDNRALQAAVDYIAALGGGTVRIGPGEYLMRDSLHLRSGVRVVGSGKETLLTKAAGIVFDLGIDGDFGEQQITTVDGVELQIGLGVAVWDDQAGGFHTTVARITGKTDNIYSIDQPLMADCLVSRGAKAGTLYPVISGYNITDASVSQLTVDGNKQLAMMEMHKSKATEGQWVELSKTNR